MEDLAGTAMNFKTKFQISYSPDDANHLLLFLFGFEVLLILGYCIVWIILPGLEWGPISLFLDVDREVSIPTLVLDHPAFCDRTAANPTSPGDQAVEILSIYSWSRLHALIHG
jgi:hypothetical protein